MKAKNLNSYVATYKELLQKGDVQIAYAELVKYVQKLKSSFTKEFSGEYSVGNVFQGYMDYTYFYLSSDYLKGRSLKLGVVLNHSEAKFEIWLLGQTKDVQRKYWHLLKNSKWVKGTEIPQYSIFDATLIENPNFDDLDKLTDDLKKKVVALSNEIVASIKQVD